MSLIRLSFLILTIGICFQLQLSAQYDVQKEGGKLEITGGLVFYGPANRMKTQLMDQGFDERVQGFIFGPIQYPVIVSEAGTHLALSYSWSFKPKQRLGIEFNHAYLREIAGLNGAGNSLELGFNTYGLGVFYSYSSRPWTFKVGPQLNLNRVYGIDIRDFNEVKETVSTTLSAGLNLAIEIYLWNGKRTYGKLGTMYLVSYATEHGPYPFDNGPGSLESSNLNFGYGSVYLSLGINL